ncbi:hypothetical protein Tco_0104410 [Tanacetum coccineum]
MEGTVRCDANYVPLSPISFLERISLVYGDHVNFTWKQTRDRCVRLASALALSFQIHRNDVFNLNDNLLLYEELGGVISGGSRI